MKKTTLAEVIVKVLVAALTAFLTALGTTSCMRSIYLSVHNPAKGSPLALYGRGLGRGSFHM